MGLQEGPGTLTIDSDLVVRLNLLPTPARCPTPEGPFILYPNSWQEEGTIRENSSYIIPGAFLGIQNLPSFCPTCVLGTR